MPPTTTKSGLDLAIQVDSLRRPFKPGDVVTGRVIRQSHAVSPMATVEICLLGRAKVKLGKTRYNGQSTYTTYYRGRFNFFGSSTRQQLFTGPIHIPPEGPGESWEFAIRIPLHPSPTVLLGGHSDSKSSFLPLAPNAIASSTLPGSFVASGRAMTTKFQSYVEYHLEASLIQQNNHGTSSTATIPVMLQSSPLPYPLTSFDLKRYTQAAAVRTYRLIPGMEDIPLSFKQKTQKLFHSSKVPALHFVAQVDCPGVIQLGNPSPVPFRVTIAPDRRQTSEIIHDAPQTVLIISLELVLKADTYVIAPSAFGPGPYESSNSTSHRINLPIFTPVVTDQAPEKSALSDNIIEDETLPAYDNPDASTVSDDKAQPPAYTKLDPAKSSEDGAGPSKSPSSEDGAGPSKSPSSEDGAGPSKSLSPEEGAGPSKSSGEGAGLSSKDRAVPATSDSQRKPLMLHISWDQQNIEALDIGTMMDLHIHRKHVTALGRRISSSLSCPIYPSFMTYCIKHLHRLKWKMEVVIAGESVKLEGESPVSVLGPSQSS